MSRSVVAAGAMDPAWSAAPVAEVQEGGASDPRGVADMTDGPAFAGRSALLSAGYS